MQRLIVWLVGTVAVIAGVAFILWTNSTPPAKVAPPAPPPEAAAPPPPTAPRPPTAAAPAAPSFDIVKVDPTGHAVIAGRAAPGSEVTVYDGDKPLGQVTADDRGEWVLVPTEPMSPGERQLTLEARDPASGAKTKSTDTVALAVAPPQGSGTVAVLLPGNANEPAQALQTPGARGGLSLDTAEFSQDGKLMLSGHAPAGATLRLYADNQLIGTVTADTAGKWASVSPRPQTKGTKIELRVDQLNADGSVAQRVAEPFEPQTAAATANPNIPTGKYTVQSGNSLWAIARQVYGNGTQYTVIFGANKGQIRDPNLIYPGQIITVPKS